MKKLFKILAPLLIVLLVVPMAVMFTACSSKKAIIIVPGIVGSVLYDSVENKYVVPPFSENVDVTYNELMENPTGNKQLMAEMTAIIRGGASKIEELINNIATNADGTSMNKNVTAIPHNFSEKQKYGSANFYKEMALSLSEAYPEYDVQVFQYDWRMSNKNSADQLEKFMKTNKYKDSIMLVHSMGGLVASEYFARSKSNRNRISLYASLATPYTGTVLAPEALVDPEAFVLGLLENFKFGSLDISAALKPFFPAINSMLTNLISISELQASININNAPDYAGTSFLTVDGEKVTTVEQLNAFYNSQPYSKYTSGEKAGQTREVYQTLTDLHKTFEVKHKGKMVHSTSLVNSYYLSGTNISTTKTVNFVNAKLDSIESSLSGDGIVSVASATLGLPLNSPNIILIDGASHMDICASFNKYIKTEIFNIINTVAKKAK